MRVINDVGMVREVVVTALLPLAGNVLILISMLSMMVWMKGDPLPEGAEFTADLEYKDPAPGRNRMIKLRMQLKAGSCNRAGEHSSRASLRVEDVRPGERWNQFSRVCKEILATDTTD